MTKCICGREHTGDLCDGLRRVGMGTRRETPLERASATLRAEADAIDGIRGALFAGERERRDAARWALRVIGQSERAPEAFYWPKYKGKDVEQDTSRDSV